LSEVFGYAKWANFVLTINDAKKACEGNGQAVSDHFLETRKMVSLGSGSQRAVEDFHLSRYACYLVVQNADPSKPIVALGQTYFAVRTREAEPAEEAVLFQDHGYRGLYAGETARDIAARKELAKGQQILDWMNSDELAANLFRASLTEQKLRNDPTIADKAAANRAHHDVGAAVRDVIIEQGGTPPEQLPTPTQSIQQLQRHEQKRIEAGRQAMLQSPLFPSPAPASDD
jgi:DNA-damage-inducible protein D